MFTRLKVWWQVRRLSRRLSSGDKQARRDTASSLGSMGTPHAVRPLIKALEDPERRSSAIDALKRIDPDALQAATHKAAKDAR